MPRDRGSAGFCTTGLAMIALALAGCPTNSTPPPTAPAPKANATKAEPQVAENPAAPIQPSEGKELKSPPPFDGWGKPTVALFITGQQLGYIEPCGCTGLEN